MIALTTLGSRIQELRLSQSLTLQDLADRAAVSVSMLSSVERGRKAPTVVVLARIAEGLGVTAAHLLAEPETVRVRRAVEQDVVEEPGGWQRTILTPVVPGVNFEWIRSALPPHCDAGEYPAYATGSHEFVFVESGMLRLTVGETVTELEAGDSAYFAADVVHGYVNPGGTPCVYYVAALIMRSRGRGTSSRASDPS
ncbi:transcriptional regulator, XRE family with cupin 2 sensor [Actinobacteria bacterium OK074]|nr:transcriptional regulator, XRE family with cupin 2 sensor [Actinobacteria bacterium OK074]